MALASLNFGLGLHIWDQKAEWHEPYNKVVPLISRPPQYSVIGTIPGYKEGPDTYKLPDGVRSRHTVPHIMLLN